MGYSMMNGDPNPLTPQQTLLKNQCPDDIFQRLFKSPSIDYAKYQISSHTVYTKDGYKLKVFRVRLTDDELSFLPEKSQKNSDRPVLLAHGLSNSSDGWFYAGNSIGFRLVSLGFDVWITNSRGNKYSHSHTDPEITHKKFYDYSFQEMAEWDIPAVFFVCFNQCGRSTAIF
jgi:pimeloyl-ACP methyl ester carboxylesterase